MRITLDTNVLVSAFIAKYGHPASLLELCLTLEAIDLILSEPILHEFEEVLAREEVAERFFYTKQDVRDIVSAIRESAKVISPKSTFKVIKEDPKDDIILRTAYDGRTEYIVSGDAHLLKLAEFRGIRIVTPRQMIDIIAKDFSAFLVRF